MLAARSLGRRFGDRVAVEQVSLEVSAGRLLALLGPNGSGKTTTLRMLAGLIAPTSGQVLLDGTPVTRDTMPRLRARMGFLTEAPGLWDRLTVRQNLTTYARLYGADIAQVDGVLDALAVPSAPLTQPAAQAVLDQLTPAQVRGIERVRGGWRCLHCKEKYTSQRAAALHERACEKRTGPRHTPMVRGRRWSKEKS